MAKKKSGKAKTQSISADSTSRDKSREDEAVRSAKWRREAVESIVIAIILAFLFRTFEAEAFVIPTGSMAPTLQGRHKDIKCPQCAYRYRAGASLDNEQHPSKGPVVATTCPMCHFRTMLNPDGMRVRNHVSFSGDRILVNKFAYQFGEPQRWDVFVFKFPGNAKQNYIKRLVGLPGETVRLRNGDIFVRKSGESEFSIARKPPRKLRELLHVVHDTRHIPDELIQARWVDKLSALPPLPALSG